MTIVSNLRTLARRWSDAALAQGVLQEITGHSAELAFVDRGYTGEETAGASAGHGIVLRVVKHTHAKRGFVLLPRRWVVERAFAWAAGFRSRSIATS